MTPKPIENEQRHHIEEISFQPTTSKYKLSIKILVDDVEAHRLPIIMPGATICWKRMLACNTTETSRVTIRVYKHQYGHQTRIGTVDYLVSSAVNNVAESFEYNGQSIIVNVKFPSPKEVEQAPARALAEAQNAVIDPGLLEKMGKVRAAFKTVLEIGTVLAELHPASKAVFGICTKAMEKLEAQEQCDESVESLVMGLSRMLPYINKVEELVELDQLRKTMTEMLHLIEDASNFILHYKSDGAAVRALRTLASSTAQDQVVKLLESFKLLKEDFDRGVYVQMLGSGILNNQRALLRELKPVGRARYDPTRCCLPGTRIVLIDEIIDWCQPSDTSERLLWIYGQAGLGKSSIAASVCKKLDEQKLLAASFFCKRDDAERRDAGRVLATIIDGLAARYPAYMRAVSKAIDKDPQLCSSPMQTQYEKLIQDLLQGTLPDACTSSIIVIDALDECGDKDTRRQLFTHLRNISQLTPWLKIVVTSRPDKDIQGYFDRSETVVFSTRNIHTYDAHNDIHTFINERLKETDILPTIAGDLLTEGAGGVFIWAQTACEFILNSLDPKGRYDLIVERSSTVQGPRSLDALYTTAIESSLGDGGDDNAKIIKQYLGFIIVCSTRTPLSFSTLSQLVGNQATQGVLKSAVESLGSVLYTDPNQDDAIRVYHPSFADYLVEHERSGRFCVDVNQANAQMARYCLQAMKAELKFNICGLETSYRRNKSVPGLEAQIKSTIPPYLNYSCLHWTSHLIEAAPKNGFEALLEEFVSESRMLYWVEVLSLVDRLYVAVSSTLQLVKWCKSSISETTWVVKYIDDMERFLRKFYKPISESTPHLYVSALAFSPAETQLVRISQAKFRNMLSISTGEEKTWSNWQQYISQPAVITSVTFSPDGKRIVSGSDDNTVRVWDADTGTAVGDPLVGHSSSVRSVGYSPDGKRIVSGSNDCTVRVWDADTGTAVGDPLVGHLRSVTSIGYSPDGKRIVSGSDDNTVRVWDADTGTAVGDPLVGHSDKVTSVEYSPDGKRIVSGSWDNTVRVWHTEYLLSAWLSNTSRIHQYCDPDGWVSMDQENLLFWLPEEYRRPEPDDSLFVISSSLLPRPIWLDYSNFAHGGKWANVAAT